MLDDDARGRSVPQRLCSPSQWHHERLATFLASIPAHPPLQILPVQPGTPSHKESTNSGTLFNWSTDALIPQAMTRTGKPTKYIHPRDPISLEKLPVFASCHRKSSWVKRSKKGRAGGIIKVGFDLGDCMEAWASCYGRLEKRRRGLAEGFIKKGGAIGRIKSPHHDRIFKGG